MSEKPRRPIPEQPQSEKTVLTEEQISYADQIYNRLFETYFSGVDLTHITKLNQQLKSERYNQLVRLIDKGFHDLNLDQKNLIKAKVSEKVNLNAIPEENEIIPKKAPKESAFIKQVRETQEEQHFPLNDDYRIPEPKEQDQLAIEEKDYNTIYHIDEFVNDLNKFVGPITKADIVNSLKVNFKGMTKSRINEEELLFSEVTEKPVDTVRGKETKYIFYLSAQVKSGTSIMKCELTPLKYKKLLNGKMAEAVGVKINAITI